MDGVIARFSALIDRGVANGVVGAVIVGFVALVAWTAVMYHCSREDEGDLE